MNWINEFKDETDAKECPIFGANTKKVAREQLSKVEYASDPQDSMMYKEIPPGPKLTHGLSKFESKHPEPALEKFHEFLTHLANGGCTPDLADILTLGGMAEHNLILHWKGDINQQK